MPIPAASPASDSVTKFPPSARRERIESDDFARRRGRESSRPRSEISRAAPKREFYLRQQLRAVIQSELGEGDQAGKMERSKARGGESPRKGGAGSKRIRRMRNLSLSSIIRSFAPTSTGCSRWRASNPSKNHRAEEEVEELPRQPPLRRLKEAKERIHRNLQRCGSSGRRRILCGPILLR